MKERQLKTKIDFLNQEFTLAQKENKHLKSLLQLNKQIIQSLTQDQNLQKVFSLLYQENTYLQNLNEMISIQRDEAVCKVRLNEQIAEEAYNREKQLQKEQKFQSFPNDENVQGLSHSHTQLLLFQEIEYAKSRLQQYLKENQALQNANYTVTPDDSLDELPMKVQQKLSPKSFIPIPKLDLTKAQKIQRINVKKQEEQEEQEQLKKAQTPLGSNAFTMFTSQNKIQQNLIVVTEQFRQVQRELHQYKLKLEEEMLSQKRFEDELQIVRKQLEEEYELNEQLIISQQLYEQKWQKAQKTYKKLEKLCMFIRKDQSTSISSRNSFKGELKIINLLEFDFPKLKLKKSMEIIQLKQQILNLAYKFYQSDERKELKEKNSKSLLFEKNENQKSKRRNSK